MFNTRCQKIYEIRKKYLGLGPLFSNYVYTRVKTLLERLDCLKEFVSFEIAVLFSLTVQASEQARRFQNKQIYLVNGVLLILCTMYCLSSRDHTNTQMKIFMCALARKLRKCDRRLVIFSRELKILSKKYEHIFELFRFNRYVRLGAFRHAYRICVTGLKSMILNPRPSKVIF